MPQPLASFPDGEAAILDTVAAEPGVADSGTETPPDLQDRLPFVRVARVGGPDNVIDDYPLVDVDVFAATRAVAAPLAERLRQRLLAGPHRTPAGVIDRVRTTSGPVQLPWADPGIRRFGATYRAAMRR